MTEADHADLSRQLAPEGWIRFDGGACPVKDGARYSALHRDGSVSTNRLARHGERWAHLGTQCDIVAYRLDYTAAEAVALAVIGSAR